MVCKGGKTPPLLWGMMPSFTGLPCLPDSQAGLSDVQADQQAGMALDHDGPVDMIRHDDGRVVVRWTSDHGSDLAIVSRSCHQIRALFLAVSAARGLSFSRLAFARSPSGSWLNSPLSCLGCGLRRLS